MGRVFLSGPKSREVVRQLGDGGADRLSFMGCGDVDIGLLRCKIGRLSVTGEMGYEIHCRMGDHIALRRLLLEAGWRVIFVNLALMRSYPCG